MLSENVFLVLLALLAGEIHCNAQDDAVKLAEANNHFAIRLLRELSNENPESNLFFSPTSISVALAMVYAGARGKSETDLSKVLGHTAVGLSSRESVLGSYKKVLAELKTDDVTMDVANAVLVHNGLKVLESYQKDLVDTFAAKFSSVDFATKGSAVASEINEWVKNKTRGMIPNIAGEKMPAYTIMVLLNAIYFKGIWESSFSPDHTTPQPFYNKGTKEVSVRTMTLRGKIPSTYEPDLESEVIELPYKGGRHSMMIILPTDNQGLAKLRGALTVEKIEKIHKKLRQGEHRIFLPKFELKTKYDLNAALMGLGLSSVFAGADLSGITADHGLAVSEVKHMAAIEVNEEGAVAAGTTMVRESRTGYPTFVVDHPFLFYIIKKDTGRVLFLGEIQEL